MFLYGKLFKKIINGKIGFYYRKIHITALYIMALILIVKACEIFSYYLFDFGYNTNHLLRYLILILLPSFLTFMKYQFTIIGIQTFFSNVYISNLGKEDMPIKKYIEENKTKNDSFIIFNFINIILSVIGVFVGVYYHFIGENMILSVFYFIILISVNLFDF